MLSIIRKGWFQAMLVAGVVALAVYVVLQTNAEPLSKAADGDTAPSFQLNQLAGGQLKLSDYEGKGVVLNFWASWCNPCVNELPLLNEAYKLAGIDMIAINVGEEEETVKKFVDRYELAFPIALDREQDVKRQYRAAGLPLTVVIDEQGNIMKRHEGELTEMSDILALMGEISDEK
ncbi:redoxin domain-containing protein [Paenibacillus sp. PAMC21692]|uniref:redoxin domain-containing protein n=1 Tax=Paenibacillus sp. PAMC21692 TaxID=2762320 RepID=UPI0021C3DD7E|nr:redoxin domain-containing protein [Paenibacillus sp. PAMC21692]